MVEDRAPQITCQDEKNESPDILVCQDFQEEENCFKKRQDFIIKL